MALRQVWDIVHSGSLEDPSCDYVAAFPVLHQEVTKNVSEVQNCLCRVLSKHEYVNNNNMVLRWNSRCLQKTFHFPQEAERRKTLKVPLIPFVQVLATHPTKRGKLLSSPEKVSRKYKLNMSRNKCSRIIFFKPFY